MHLNILWTGRKYYSLENCLVNTTGSGTEIKSTIIGMHGGTIYHVEYQIITNGNWETIFFELNNRHSNLTNHLKFEGDGRGNWVTNGKPADQFTSCIDIDIPLTPFTNSLPINRLKLRQGEGQEIQVIYLDLLQNEVKPVRQKYTRLSKSEYQYQNVPNEFEARIEVDELGLVVDYPELFVRLAQIKTD